MLAYPDLIKLVHRLLNDFWLISQDASLEVTRAISFHADAGTCKIGTTNIRLFAIKDHHLEMHPWAKHSLQPIIQNGEPVKVLPEVRPWLLSMNQPHSHTFLNQLSQHLQERLLCFPILDIQILDISRPNPQRLKTRESTSL